MVKLFITGISGFLGTHLAKAEWKDYELYGSCFTQVSPLAGNRTQLIDLTHLSAVEAMLQREQPDAILHIAALSNPNFCEQQTAASYAMNVLASQHLAYLAKARNLPFLFTSTDLVFDGSQAPYSVDMQARPISIYGQHKLMAERAILECYPEATIARLPLLYATAGKNFLANWITQLKMGQQVFAFEDEYRTALHVKDAVQGLQLLLKQGKSGIWHLGGPERMSRYEFAVKAAQALGLDTNLIIASRQKDVKMPAPRPADVSLDSSASYAIGFQPKQLLTHLKESTIEG
ncbi:MAG: SDR family oxidoreductase [Saprospiraceae bacterium]|nr:SDR family oxidoreductase [Saprospiraceae bacterium]